MRYVSVRELRNRAAKVASTSMRSSPRSRPLARRSPPAPLPRRLPDHDDEPFLEVALAAGAACLVTGNLRHFPAATRSGVRVVTPAWCVEKMRSET